jgi:heme A synthase
MMHRYAVLVAVYILILIISGAAITSMERPSVTPLGVSLERWHSGLAVAAGVLILGLAIWVLKDSRPWFRRLAWITLGAAIVEGLLGIRAFPFLSILHALIAHLLFAACAAIAVFTSPRWHSGPEPVQDSWRPSLGSLAILTPGIVLLQITLGAAYRFRAMSVLWHVLNAMLVLLLLLVVTVFLIRQFPLHPSLRPAAVALAVITSAQVALGFATLLMLLLADESSLAVILCSIAHVGLGALTLAASVILGIQIRYHRTSDRLSGD